MGHKELKIPRVEAAGQQPPSPNLPKPLSFEMEAGRKGAGHGVGSPQHFKWRGTERTLLVSAIKDWWRWRTGGVSGWGAANTHEHSFQGAFWGLQRFLGQEGGRILGFTPSGHDAERHPGARSAAAGRGIPQLASFAASALHQRFRSASASSRGSKNSHGRYSTGWELTYLSKSSLATAMW